MPLVVNTSSPTFESENPVDKSGMSRKSLHSSLRQRFDKEFPR